MLLAHTSGLLNFAFLERDKKLHLHFRPGTKFSYSGEGINLVQFVIEQQKHRPLDQLMQEAFFTPLKMTRTGMIYREEFAANVADRFDVNEKFRAKTRRFPARAAGSMTTSAEELAFRPLLEKILGDTVTPWEWKGYTREHIEASRKN